MKGKYKHILNLVCMYNCTRILLLNHLGGGPVVRVWDQEVCFLYGLRFELCGYLYDGHWRLTWSLISGLVRLVEMRASWPDTYVKLKKKEYCHLFYYSILSPAIYLNLKVLVLQWPQ